MNSARATVRPLSCPIFHAKVDHPFRHRRDVRLPRHAARATRRTIATMTVVLMAKATRARVAIATEVSEAMPAIVVTGVDPVIVADAEAVAIAAAERAVARVATTTVVIPAIPAVHAITWTPRLISSRGARARNETGVRSGAISCVFMFATISRK